LNLNEIHSTNAFILLFKNIGIPQTKNRPSGICIKRLTDYDVTEKLPDPKANMNNINAGSFSLNIFLFAKYNK
jgi:hypothetical protein